MVAAKRSHADHRNVDEVFGSQSSIRIWPIAGDLLI
jgi:hypothetical protein